MDPSLGHRVRSWKLSAGLWKVLSVACPKPELEEE